MIRLVMHLFIPVPNLIISKGIDFLTLLPQTSLLLPAWIVYCHLCGPYTMTILSHSFPFSLSSIYLLSPWLDVDGFRALLSRNGYRVLYLIVNL